MKAILLCLFCSTLLFCGSASGQERMTSEQFKQLVATPGDSIPLIRQLAQVPFWKEARCSNSMKYADGKVFKEECLVRGKTVQGKYIIYTMSSDYYQQAVHGILEYDEKAQAYKQWALLGATLTETTVVIDFEKKISASSGTYEPKFLEISVGTFSDKETSDHTQVYKDGVLFLTRDVVTRPVSQANARPSKPAGAGAAS